MISQKTLERMRKNAQAQVPKCTEAQVRAVAHMLLGDAAKALGVTPRTAAKYEKKLNIRFPRAVKTPFRPTREDFAAACKTMTVAECAAHWDVAKSTINNWRAEFGLNPLSGHRGSLAPVENPLLIKASLEWIRRPLSGAQGINGWRYTGGWL